MSEPSFWAQPPAVLFEALQSGSAGLTESVARDRIALLPKVRAGQSKWRFVALFGSQFKSPIILILLFAAGVSIFLGDAPTASIIFTIVLCERGLGFWQEQHAADAVQKLLAMVQITASVLRSGKPTLVPVSEIVPGDVFVLSGGVIVPADSLLLESTDLFVDEASLTGEAFPIEKKTGTTSRIHGPWRTDKRRLSGHQYREWNGKGARSPRRKRYRVWQSFRIASTPSA